MSNTSTYIEKDGEILPRYEGENAPYFPHKASEAQLDDAVDSEELNVEQLTLNDIDQSDPELVVNNDVPDETSREERLEPEAATHATRMNRLNRLKNSPDAGFYPTTKEELSRANRLLDGNPRTVVQKHLQEVKGKQIFKSGAEEPDAAVRSITREFGHYTSMARRDLTFLSGLAERVADIDYPFRSLSEEFGDNDLGVNLLVRYFYAKACSDEDAQVSPPFDFLKSKGEKDNQPVDPFINPDPDSEAMEHIQDFADSRSIGDIRELVEEARVDQEQRLGFWTHKLRQARLHAVARPVADAIFSELGIE